MPTSTNQSTDRGSPALLLIGPQLSRVTANDVIRLRSTIKDTAELFFLLEAVNELETIWPTLVETFPELETLPGDLACEDIELNVLTVLFHVVDFWRASATKIQSGIFPSLPHSSSHLADIQGLCIGFLTAAAVSCSMSGEIFRRNIAVSLRIAVGVGALVEYDSTTKAAASISVGWSSHSERQALQGLCEKYAESYISCITDDARVTVTLPGPELDPFLEELTHTGLSAQSIGLIGRYHHRGTYQEAVYRFKGLCNRDPRFQFPNLNDLYLPLRSNVDGGIISGSLHDAAINTILLEQCNWVQTVRQAFGNNAGEPKQIVPIGSMVPIPRSVVKHPVSNGEAVGSRSTRVNGSTNGASHTLPHGATASAESDSIESLVAADPPVIAVIGMGCRFPEAEGLEEFWELMQSGKSAVRPLSEDRFKPSDLSRGPNGAFWGNFLRAPDEFDHRFFGISGREAKYMDPQQRLLLQVAYEGLESAGYFGLRNSHNTDPSDVGCYIGIGSVDYEENINSHDTTAFSAVGSLRAFISGRVSHHFGWTGPSITVDTACSSGAVAIHSAVNALKSKEVSMAVAGGVNVITSPFLYQNLAGASFLSPTGASKAFDAGANGYCRGEGVGVVVLKTLPQALADGNSVLALIRASAVNQAMNCGPITVPVSASQTSLYRKALSTAGVDPRDVTYVEAHGTGTPVGDPIECESVRQAFGGPQREHELFVGSVKDNIGHTESASGAAALIKTETIPWTPARRIAVVNNYGAAGSNVAIVVDDPTSIQSKAVIADAVKEYSVIPSSPFFISAKSPEALQEYCSSFSLQLSLAWEKQFGAQATQALAYNLSVKQNRQLDYNYTFSASSVNELKAALNRVNERDFRKRPQGNRPVVLCIGGQNGCTAQIDPGIYETCSLFKNHLDACEATCQILGLPSLFPSIFQSQPIEDLVSLHCILFSIQYSSAKSWLDTGLEVDTIIGHSFGQLTALVVADAVSLEDGLRLLSERARLLKSCWGGDPGSMLSIQGGDTKVRSLLDTTNKLHPGLSHDIACFNGPDAIVVAGSTESIEAVEETSRADGLYSHLKLVRLRNTHAFHSRLVEAIVPGLRKVAADIKFQVPSLRIESCSKDQDWTLPINAEIIVQHSRMPVYFYEAVQRTARRLGSCVWVEAGSASPIIPMVRRALGSTEASSDSVFQPLSLCEPEGVSNLSRATANLWAAGVGIQYWPFHKSQKVQFPWINLPSYPFRKTSHWLQYNPPVVAPKEDSPTTSEQGPGQLLNLLESDHQSATFQVNCSHPMFVLCTNGHAVLNQSLCPASMYVEIAAHAVTELGGGGPTAGLHSSANNRRGDSPFNSRSESQQTRDPSTKHAHGTICMDTPESQFPTGRLQSLKRLVSQVRQDSVSGTPGVNMLNDKAIIYRLFGQVVNYAPFYQGVEHLVSKNNEAVGSVHVPSAQDPVMKSARCDPITVDNFLQVAGILVNCLSDSVDGHIYICTELGHLYLSENFFVKRGKRSPGMSIRLFHPVTGELFAMVIGATFHSVAVKSLVAMLANLNTPGVSLANTQTTQPATNGTKGVKNSQTLNSVHTNLYSANNRDSGNVVGIEQNMDWILSELQQLLSSATEIPVNEIAPTTYLTNIGIDSLMSTEVLSDIRRQFHVNIPVSEFIALDTVLAVAESLHSHSKAESNARHIKENKVNGREVHLPSFGPAQELLGDILGVSVDEISVDMSLADLGVDSLVSTELLSEVKKRFGIAITTEGFQDIQCVGDLSRRVQAPNSAPSIPGPRNGHQNGSMKSRQDPPNQRIEVQNLEPTRTTGSFISVAQECFLSARSSMEEMSNLTQYSGFCQRVLPAQEELVVAYVIQAFDSLGCPLGALNVGQNLPDTSVLPRHHKVKNQIYKLLAEQGLIECNASGQFRRTKKPAPLEQPEKLLEWIISKFPQHAFEHTLLASTGSKLAECLTGKADPLEILFGSTKSRALLENVYTHAPMFETGTMSLTQYLVGVFQAFGERRPIRVLELGAGTGGTTKRLVEALITTGKEFEYTFTDISASLVAAARRKFAQHSFFHYAVIDIEQDPPAQYQNQYDIVISTNCIHATKDLTVSCTNINKLLHSNGLLCLVELTRNLFWFDLVFGLLDGWWRFEDGRQHALASETLWRKCLTRSGFQWVDWTAGITEESSILRVIVASPSNVTHTTTETVEFKRVGDLSLKADIYYPRNVVSRDKRLPVALMIHGGGHIMLSRKDIRPSQAETLLDHGFLPVSIDYRLCPEITLSEGPMTDVYDALAWARTVLPRLPLQRRDISIDGECVVGIGWSTGGHLALTLGFTSPLRTIRPPDAILVFYCPLDYEDPFWSEPNFPFGDSASPSTLMQHDLLHGVHDKVITAYNPPRSRRALGGWMAPSDDRSLIALHMNWKGHTLRILLNGLSKHSGVMSSDELPEPTQEQIQAVSPLAQIRRGAYTTPTFIIHGTEDDLIPWKQAVRTFEALRQRSVIADLRILDGAEHLFDLYPSYKDDLQAAKAVQDGYEFLRRHVGL
ncbi:Type I Polyketide synthases (Type I PKS) [Penicillium mononematosum]|uniref:Type I Polyketide synthases (Type I PKS) n=1 Tax=Penicillium mononematosum TaxID=268346 RepID=UPI00254950FF|nr:Type I Polyketide synthases (Type I PKS) [Penicillium mononematosum]KAJ6184467.1 Type I Polyketide synthases (Type I PKS) [Penicillium mononematosum]